MSDTMNFSNTWEQFLHDYEFEDARRVYTNGSRLIPSFRVKQMVEHYFSTNTSPVGHRKPVIKQRPEKYERYDQYCLNENGEMLYLKRIFVDEKSYAMYCPACGKRLCSRFMNFCPNCGVKIYGGTVDG